MPKSARRKPAPPENTRAPLLDSLSRAELEAIAITEGINPKGLVNAALRQAIFDQWAERDETPPAVVPVIGDAYQRRARLTQDGTLRLLLAMAREELEAIAFAEGFDPRAMNATQLAGTILACWTGGGRPPPLARIPSWRWMGPRVSPHGPLDENDWQRAMHGKQGWNFDSEPDPDTPRSDRVQQIFDDTGR